MALAKLPQIAGCCATAAPHEFRLGPLRQGVLESLSVARHRLFCYLLATCWTGRRVGDAPTVIYRSRELPGGAGREQAGDAGGSS